MWQRVYKKTFKDVQRKSIWRLWKNVESWPSWHKGLDYCQIKGRFVIGNSFLLKPKGFWKLTVHLTEVNENVSFTDCVSFFGSKIYVSRMMEESQEGLTLTNKIVVTGFLKWLWIIIVARNLHRQTPVDIETIVRLAKDAA